MTPARHSATRASFYDSFDSYRDVANFDVVPEERIGRPLSSRAGRTIVKALLLLLLVGGGTWAVRDNPAILQTISQEIARLKLASFVPPTEQTPGPSLPKLLSPASSAPPPEPPSATQQHALAPLPPAPVQIVSDRPAEAASAAAPAAGDSRSTGAGTPYSAPPALPADPNRKKAEAAGLHPDISPALLARLTAADFRNARRAIDTALAETADDAVYLWPKKKVQGIALFKVHFVPGAGQNCRRYVVTIAKDGWLTTALPMERCGVQRRTASAARN
jgi:hypothetical protein